MQPYEQPSQSTALEDAYILPPPVMSGEFDEYERLKRRSRFFYQLEKAFLLAIPLLFFLAVFLNIKFFFRHSNDDLWFVLAAGFRVGLLLSFLASLGVLWTYRRSLPSSVASRSPYLSVLLMLAPGFNLYWYYVEFSLGFADGTRALDELEGNRLRFRSESVVGIVTLALFILACALFAICFAHDSHSDLSAALDFLTGNRNFFGESEGDVVAWFTSLASLFAACGLHLRTSRRMSEIAVHILEVRQAIEPLATDVERAEARARLDATLGAPPSR